MATCSLNGNCNSRMEESVQPVNEIQTLEDLSTNVPQHVNYNNKPSMHMEFQDTFQKSSESVLKEMKVDLLQDPMVWMCKRSQYPIFRINIKELPQRDFTTTSRLLSEVATSGFAAVDASYLLKKIGRLNVNAEPFFVERTFSNACSLDAWLLKHPNIMLYDSNVLVASINVNQMNAKTYNSCSVL